MDAKEFKEIGEKFRRACDEHVRLAKEVEAVLLSRPRAELVGLATKSWSQLDLTEAIVADMSYEELLEFLKEK